MQRTTSSPVALSTAQPGSRAPAGGYSVVCPDGAHGIVTAAPGPEFLGCRARRLPQNSWPASLPPAPFSRVVIKKQSPLAWRVGSQQLLFEAIPASGCLVPVHVLPRSSAWWPPHPPHLPPSDHTGASAVPSGMSGARTMGRCPPEGSARVHLAPSSPKLSPGLWRAVGWRLRVHRYCVLSENRVDWVGATRGPSSCQCYRHTPSPCLRVAYSLTGEKEAQQTV